MKKKKGTEVIGANGKPLVVNGLFKKYNEKADYAIRDITFTCESGEIVGLLGLNGAGKSTTLKCITGILPFSEGTIEICGIDINKHPIEAKSNFSFVADNHTAFMKMTGMQYLMFMADVYNIPTEDRQNIIDKLDGIFNLGDAINKLISDYSHGMKQKICMMGSLIHSPKLWILDEPMIGLDPRTQGAVISFMKEYVGEDKTILFSSHNLDIVSRICDRAIIINNGQLVKEINLKDTSEKDLLEKYYITGSQE